MSTLTDSDKQLLADIENIGWHIIHISEDETGPGLVIYNWTLSHIQAS